jgi:hypothetical protein
VGDGRTVDASGRQRPDVSLVIPAFNEEDRLPQLLGALRSHVGESTEVIVVDDGSVDATSAVAQDALASVGRSRVVRLDRNRGKGAAVRAGVREAAGRVVAYMDADMATSLSGLPTLIDGLAHADVSIGSRAHDRSIVRSARVDRTIMGRTFNGVARAVAGFDHLDTQCGFKAFRRPAAKLLFATSRIDGFAFDVEVLHLAHQLGLRVVETPVDWAHVDGSKVRPWSDAVRMLSDTLRVTAHRRSKLVLAGLALTGAARSVVEQAVRRLDEDPLVGSDRDSIEVLLPPTEVTQAPVLTRHFVEHGVTVTPVQRTCDDYFGARRTRRLSIGLPQPTGVG